MNLTFINPLFLWGLPLVGIPVIVHLLTKKKARKLDFSDIKFIQLASFKAVRRHKLKELLLLLMRMLIVLLVVLFFARPVFYALPILTSGDQLSSNIVFILDNSYSMGYREGEKSSFSLAKNILIDLVNKLDKKDKAAFLLMNTKVESPVANLTPDKKVLIGEVEKSALTFQSTDVSGTLTKAYAILKESVTPNKQIVLITDLASNGYKNIPEKGISKEGFKEFDPQVKFIFIDVGDKHQGNLSVAKVLTEPGIISEPVKIKVTIANHGARKSRDLETSLYIGEASQSGNLKRVSQGFVSAGTDSQKDKNFFYNFLQTGIYLGMVEIAPDNLTVDDRYYFKLPVEDKINVLLVDGAPDISFYNSETYYLKLAMNPVTDGSSVNSQICTVKELETKKLTDFSVIVLANVKELNSSLRDKLYQFLLNGGGLIFFTGDNVNLEEYNAQFSRFLPAKLIKIEGQNTRSDKFFQTIAPPEVKDDETVHPVLKPFIGQEAGELDKAHFYKYLAVEPDPEAKVLLKFSNGSPYLLEREITGKNKGKVLFFTSSADRNWNNLPAKPAYVALAQQTVRYLAKRQEVLQDEEIHVDGKIIKTFPALKVPEAVQIINPDQRSFSLKPVQDKDIYKIEFDQVDTPGIYQLIYNWRDKLEKEYIAVNLDLASGESDLEKIDKGRLKKLFPQSPLVIVDDLKNIDAEFLRLLKGKELSKNLLLLLVGLVIVEGFLGNFKRRN